MKIKNEDFKNIFVTEHACKRWRQRVDPTRSRGRKSISEYVKKCAINNKIETSGENTFVLENDIVIMVKLIESKKSKKLLLLTTYGKISEVPALGNIKEMLKYGKSHNKYNKDRVKLSIKNKRIEVT